MKQKQTQWTAQLEELTAKVLRLGGLVEQAIGQSIQALIDRDSELAEKVIENDKNIDRLELEIDSYSLEMLALFQPFASDLRFVTTAMKITTDLERIGDLSVNISERALELNREQPLRPIIDLPLMASKAQQMVRDALDAFVRRDTAMAKSVIAMDDELDSRMERTFHDLLSFMLEEPSAISRCLRLTFIAKYFERMGDMATNICEQVVFMAKGEVVKHPSVRDTAESG